MEISEALRISNVRKNKGPDFAQFWSKPSEAVWDRRETAQRFMENVFLDFYSKMWYLLTKNMKEVTVKCENLQRGQSDPAFGKNSKHFFAVAPFMVQISPKYYHSLEPQNQTRHQ